MLQHKNPRTSPPLNDLMRHEPSKDELAKCWVLDGQMPDFPNIHLGDLTQQVQDGIYAKDKLSDQVVEIILWALEINPIDKEAASLFQTLFYPTEPPVTDLTIRWRPEFRPSGPRHGTKFNPFLDPDGKILVLNDHYLCGDYDGKYEISELDPKGLKAILATVLVNIGRNSLLCGGACTLNPFETVSRIVSRCIRSNC